jgi:hypothetical protein
MAGGSMSHQEAYELELRQHQEQSFYNESRKFKATVNTVEVKEVDERNERSAPEASYWQPGIKARFPWVGCGALIMMLACIAFQVVILTTSNGKVKEKWPGMWNAT